MQREDSVEAALYAATALARERIRARQREASERRSTEFLERQVARKRLSAKTGKSEDVLLAEEMKAGDERVLAWAEERRRQTRRFLRQSVLARPHRTRPSASHRRVARPRAHRARRTARNVGSRGDPHQSDDDPEPEHRGVARRALSPEVRDYLRTEVDRRVRQGIADQKVADKALFRAVEAWGEAGIVA